MASSKSSIENVTVLDSGAFDCGVCKSPLKMPIFQCEVGHMVCSECSEKMAAAERCHMCRRTLAGGYKRCYGAEHIVECLRVPCPNKAYGCSIMLARYDESAHLQVCQHRPFRCPAEDCTFAARHLLTLLAHVDTHRWPSTVACDLWSEEGSNVSTDLALVDGFNLIKIYSRKMKLSGMVLLKVRQESFGRAVTAIDIRPRNSKKCWLKFEYKAACGTHRWEYEFDGSLLDGYFDFVVPKSAHPLEMDTMKNELACMTMSSPKPEL